jgi:secreted PhoX family phosphatase
VAFWARHHAGFDDPRRVWDSWLVTLRRRTLLKAAAGAAAIGAPLAFLFRRDARADGGPLVVDPARILDLPAGFRYTILQRTFEPMSDGLKVPGRPDGMGCFAGPAGSLVLMRNHELDRSRFEAGYDTPPAESFDARASGGVTRVVLDEKTLEVISSNRVLAGTLRNCSGGVSPWGWLSCEESVEAGHGYVFRCRTDAARVAAPERLTAYGRFNHEAVCVDPRTFTAYLTEDRSDGCLYRYQPSDPSRPHSSGKLQALRVAGVTRFDTSRDLDHGTRLDVDWVNVPEPNPKTDSVRAQAATLGAARFARGEGIVLSGGSVYICCTSGGRAGLGQLFKLSLGSGSAPDKLELFAESPGSSVLDMPDNICMAPWGDLLVAEDGAGEQLLRGITPDGRVYDLARNAASHGELAGICVSPKGNALFLNLQLDGLTLAITGPLEELGRRRAKHFARRPA